MVQIQPLNSLELSIHLLELPAFRASSRLISELMD